MSHPLHARLSTRPALPFVLALSLVAVACGGEDMCETGASQSRTELFFGQDRANDVPVSEAEWQNFVDTVVTPLFKTGLTMFDADGQYLMDNGVLVHENSKVIVLLHDGSSARSRDINTIRDEYKSRFDQEAVLRIDSISCVSFD